MKILRINLVPKEGSEKSKFGPQPNFNDPNFDFCKELKRLPFPLNLGEVEMSTEQQVRFLKLIYDNQIVYSLCDEDLGLCDQIKHTIPTIMDKPVYLPHRTIPVQLQARCKSVLMPGFSKVSFILHVVLTHCKSLLSTKNLGKFCLCIDFRALNAVTVHNSFLCPGSRKHCKWLRLPVWFTSFNLAQGYLQLVMDEADIHKTAFWAGSSGLYEFTRMPFSLSNVGA